MSRMVASWTENAWEVIFWVPDNDEARKIRSSREEDELMIVLDRLPKTG